MVYRTRSHSKRGIKTFLLSIVSFSLCLTYAINWPAFAGRNFGSGAAGPNLPQAAAIRNLPGFLANTLGRNDDLSTGAVPLGFTINFFGTNYSNLFVNNNGNVTFDSELGQFTPFPLTAAQRVIIAAFFADVDTNGAASGVVTYGNDTVNGRPAFGVNWINVGYFSSRTDKLNSFQLILINRSDTGAGNFDIEFNYNNILWETGDASGGVNGLGGSSARAGYSNGTANAGTFFELSGSAINGAFLDSNPSLGLTHNSLNSNQLGRYVFGVRGGAPQSLITFSPGILSHPPGSLDPLVQVVQQNGRFEITPRSNMTGLRYNGFISDQRLNVSNSNVRIQALQTGTGGAQTFFGLVENSDNFMRFVKVDGSPTVTTMPDGTLAPYGVLDATGSFLIFQVKVNGVLSSFNIPFDGVLHRHWRFRNEPATIINFDTSPDQIVWTVQKRVVLQRSVSALTAELSAGTSTSVANPGMAVFQNFMLTSTPPATGSPLDGPEFFARAHYYDFLNRDPDASGIAFWSNQISSCGTDAACIDLRRINVSAAFFISTEFQQTGYLVYRMYKAAHGNLSGTPVPLTFNEFLPDTQRIGLGVVVNQPGWEQVLENNKNAFAAEFVARDRFTTAYPSSMTPTNFVAALFTNAEINPSAGERQAIINEFGSAANTGDVAARGRVLRRVAEHPTFEQREFNRAFVLMQYFGYLRRNPNDPPEPTLDFQGYNFWLNKLNQFNGNFLSAEMVKAFIISGEYRQRFGP